MNKRISMIVLTLICVMFMSNVAFADEIKLNDGVYHTLTFSEGSGDIEKTFTIDKKGTVYLKARTTMMKCKVLLYEIKQDDKEQYINSWYYEGASDFDIQRLYLNEGKFKLVVEPNDFFDNSYIGDYIFNITYEQSKATYDTPMNYTHNNAISIDYNMTIDELLVMDGDINESYEYYSFYVPNEGYVELEYISNMESEIEIFNEYGVSITYDIIRINADTTTIGWYLNKGKYVFSLQPGTWLRNDYGEISFKLKYRNANVTKEIDNYDFIRAYEIKYGEVFNGVLTENKSDEYYKIQVKDKETVTFCVNSTIDSEGIKFEIFDVNENRIDYDICWSGEKKLTKILDKGIYYIRLTDAEGEYSLRVGKDISEQNISLSNEIYSYNGYECKPIVYLSMNGKMLVLDKDYTVTYANNINPGVATVTVIGKGDYIGSISKTFTINKTNLSNAIVKLSYSKTMYSNSYKKPTVTVIYGGKTLLLNMDYTVSYTNNKYPGTATVTIIGKGIYNGTIRKTFEINAPDLVATSKVSANLYGYNDVKISWKKVSGATGYYVYYKTSSMKSYKQLRSTTALTYKKSNLADGQKFVFRIYPYVKINGKVYIDSSYKNSNTINTLKKTSGVKVKKASKTKVKISWSDMAGESGYEVYRATSSKGKYKKVATTSKKTVTIKATRNKKYYYKVRAYKTVNGKKLYAPWSNVISYKLK